MKRLEVRGEWCRGWVYPCPIQEVKSKKEKVISKWVDG